MLLRSKLLRFEHPWNELFHLESSYLGMLNLSNLSMQKCRRNFWRLILFHKIKSEYQIDLYWCIRCFSFQIYIPNAKKSLVKIPTTKWRKCRSKWQYFYLRYVCNLSSPHIVLACHGDQVSFAPTTTYADTIKWKKSKKQE